MMTTVGYSGLVSTPSPPSGFLYSFSNFLFTSANTAGNTGPNLSTATSYYTGNSYYNGNTWVSSTSYYNVTNGIQYWTVPATGTYTIVAAGASGGGDRGLGANISGNFNLTQGEIVRILVGQRGNVSANTGSGGGGTFVVKTPYNTTPSILVIAGGGGGQYSTQTAANAGGSGNITGLGIGTVASNGGGGGATNSNGGNGVAGSDTGTGGYAGGGGGFFGNGGYGGTLVTQPGGEGGRSFTNGGTGGGKYVVSGVTNGDGGFGGGGGTGARGAGGGGYNGGQAGFNSQSGYGGSSYNSGFGQSNTGNINVGDGYVQITYGGAVSTSLVYDLDAANYAAMPANGATVAGTGGYTISVANAGSSVSWNSANGGVFRKSNSTGTDVIYGGPNYTSTSQSYSVFMAYKLYATAKGRLLNTQSEASADWLLGSYASGATSYMNVWYPNSTVNLSSDVGDLAWHFIWATYDATTGVANLYIATNTAPAAVYKTQTFLTSSVRGFNQLRLFSRAAGSEVQTADIGFVKVWDNVLSLSNIQDLHSTYKARFGY